MISGDLRRSGGVDLREGVESSVPQDDALLNSTLRPHRCGRQGHPSMRPATKRWGRRLEGPLAEVARTASAFLARSAEGEAPSYGSNAAALSLYSQQRWRRVLTRVLVPTCFASTCCHGASAPRAMIQSPWPERCGSQRPMGRCAGRHAQALLINTQIRALAPRAFISAFSCRCSVGSNSPYSHSAAGGRRAVSTRIRISCTPQGAATTWTSPMDCVCGRGGQFAVQRIIEQDEMSV